VLLLDIGARAANSGRALGLVLGSRLYLEDQGYHVACAPLEDWINLEGSGGGKGASTAVTNALTGRQQQFVLWLAQRL